MKRKDFVKNSLLKIGGIAALPLIGLESCNEAQAYSKDSNDPCQLSPQETAGPFSTKSPADLLRSTIVSDRKGIPLLIQLNILNRNDNCNPLPGAIVDVWHCDKDGLYSEYGGMRMQQADMTGVHFLRGRQTSDRQGKVSFLSIYPGWYPGRAPHVHLEVFNKNEKSICVTQIAFPEDISKTVYSEPLYDKGQSPTTNAGDGVFRNSLQGNMGSISGNMKDGYTLTYDVIVNA